MWKKWTMHTYSCGYSSCIVCLCFTGCLVCSSVNSVGINKEQGVSLSIEWMNFEIQVSALRNKVRKHALSKAHTQAVKVAEQQNEAAIENAMEAMTESYVKETEAVFRTAHHLAKKNRPFSDHESLIELQELNGVKMGSILYSCYSATQIIQHVASEMQSKMVSSIIASSSKLAVLIDEASSLSHKAVMTVSIKASIQEESPEFIFLELVELENQRADGILQALLTCLTNAGFTEEWLHENWVTFVSDGASVMLGKKSGVATRLTSRFPKGLLDRVQSPEFICDLGLMYDTLHELSLLSQELQSRSITLLRAEHLLKRSIRVIQSFKESPGEKYSEALEAKKTGEYRCTALKTNAKLKSINPGQFLQSLVNNLEKHLSFEDQTIKDLSILDQSKWPSKPSIRHGEEQIKRLSLNGMRDLLEEPSSEAKDLKPLMNCMKTFPVSTAECERNFSLMNNISSDKRAVLLISNISNLMMININGPPTSKFDPRKYTRTWVKSHRAASSVRSTQCSVKTPAESKSVWNIL
uniref:HAT C-terminal dimerisation domain-containing protein n=1 Tax=Seriola dumerili TaxID=41447 RepID=A0A3B4THP3_SERDU